MALDPPYALSFCKKNIRHFYALKFYFSFKKMKKIIQGLGICL